jgi:hypothetical protein
MHESAAMHLRELRAVLAKIILAGLPACAGDGPHSDCYETDSDTVEVKIPADPAMQLLVDSCHADATACPNLCTEVLNRKMNQGSLTSCSVGFRSDAAVVDLSWEIYVGGDSCPVSGRRAEHVRSAGELVARDLAGAWLAHAAWLEAASVYAFFRLADELALHGAPIALVRIARQSAMDEMRHAAVVASLAARFGARPAAVEVDPPAPRSLEAIAIENAVEGCVRETWGAIVASWQAATARDLEIRAAFARIARDETRHAALAWAVDRWATPRLGQTERARVADARAAAANELSGDIAHAPHLALLGLPSGKHAHELLARSRALWG